MSKFYDLRVGYGAHVSESDLRAICDSAGTACTMGGGPVMGGRGPVLWNVRCKTSWGSVKTALLEVSSDIWLAYVVGRIQGADLDITLTRNETEKD